MRSYPWLSALALVEVIVGNGLRLGGIELGALIEVVGEGFLGDLICLSGALGAKTP